MLATRFPLVRVRLQQHHQLHLDPEAGRQQVDAVAAAGIGPAEVGRAGDLGNRDPGRAGRGRRAARRFRHDRRLDPHRADLRRRRAGRRLLGPDPRFRRAAGGVAGDRGLVEPQCAAERDHQRLGARCRRQRAGFLRQLEIDVEEAPRPRARARLDEDRREEADEVAPGRARQGGRRPGQVFGVLVGLELERRPGAAGCRSAGTRGAPSRARRRRSACGCSSRRRARGSLRSPAGTAPRHGRDRTAAPRGSGRGSAAAPRRAGSGPSAAGRSRRRFGSCRSATG